MAEEQDETPTGLPRDGSRGKAAFLIIDMLANRGDTITGAAKTALARAGRAIAALRRAAAIADMPVIFVEEAAARPPESGRPADEAGRDPYSLRPAAADHIVVKPQFSGFHATGLAALLQRLGVRRLVLAGFATDVSVMFTAADAHARAFDLWVPKDMVAGTSAARDRWALEVMRQSMAAETRPTSMLSLATWLAADDTPPGG